MGAFINYYKNGDNFAPYHADKYGCDCVLISIGSNERVLRYKHNKEKINIDYKLNSGDLIYIPDKVNKEWKHSLLKTKK